MWVNEETTSESLRGQISGDMLASIVHSVADEASVKLDLHSENPTEEHSIQPEMSSTNEAKLLTETTSFCNDWFSIVGSNEHSSTKKYIQEKLGEDFSHSTDSSSNEEN